jgi:GTP pyrophosphokinase
MTFAELRAQITAMNSEISIETIEKAYNFAEKAHWGQLRKNGDEFILHPLEVVAILCDLEMDEPTLTAAFLHDVAEDTDKSLQDIRDNFGQEVASLVDGVTKLGRIAYQDKAEAQVENLRKMFLAMAKDIRVIIIKLADRLHNMRTLEYHTERKQKEIARETMEIYAPLANRLGIFRIKSELEDLAFRFLEPEAYFELEKSVSCRQIEREAQIGEVISVLAAKLFEAGIESDISGRSKHYYSIYRKMQRQEKDLGEIYDLAALRVIVNTVKDCYGALGIVHTLWKPIPGKFKDYIAMPKPNLYQSLHTILAGSYGEPFEIQIRTWDMHHTAVYGVAAHWKYKEGGKSEADFEQKLSWVRQLLEWQHDSRDVGEFMESLKVDLFDDTVFVFTPKGDVIELPADSCLVDFAYHIHSDIGHRCIGAKVNGRISPLETKLNNGDIVEIITSKTPAGPSRDWVCMVKTSQAKNRIRQWFKKEEREANIARGKEDLDREARKMNLDVQTALSRENMMELVRLFRFNTLDDLYATLGDGAITYRRALTRLKEEVIRKEDEDFVFTPSTPQKPGIKSPLVRVKGEDNMLVRFSRCCNPLPGDDIVGFITRGRGVSVHQANCTEIAVLRAAEPERLIDVSWEKGASEAEDAVYQVDISIQGADRPTFVMDVMNSMLETKTHTLKMNSNTTGGDLFLQLKLETRGKQHLDFLLNRLNRIRDVKLVKRL